MHEPHAVLIFNNKLICFQRSLKNKNISSAPLENKKTTMAKMTKSQIVTAMSEKTGLAKKDVSGFFDEIATLAYKEVKGKGEFVLPGFGKMVKARRKARMGVNPATGAKIKIAAKTVVKFRLAKAAKEAVL